MAYTVHGAFAKFMKAVNEAKRFRPAKNASAHELELAADIIELATLVEQSLKASYIKHEPKESRHRVVSVEAALRDIM